jgi:hypothetical protein
MWFSGLCGYFREAEMQIGGVFDGVCLAQEGLRVMLSLLTASPQFTEIVRNKQHEESILSFFNY